MEDAFELVEERTGVELSLAVRVFFESNMIREGSHTAGLRPYIHKHFSCRYKSTLKEFSMFVICIILIFNTI